jgi:hypothetical protein
MTDDERSAVERTVADFSRQHGISAIQLGWHADYVSAAQIGWRIAELDRAVRRTAADAQGRRTEAKVPPPADGGLAFVDAAPGSADILFEVFGFARQVLESDAVKVLLAAVALTGAIGKVWGYLFRDHDPLNGVSGRQVLEILREYHEMQVAPEGAELIGTPPASDEGGAVRTSILVAHEDGSRTVVIVEMDRQRSRTDG